MDSAATNNSYLAFISNNTKAQTLESTLHKSLDTFRDLILDFQELYIESENYKCKYETQKELCERNGCDGAETLKNIVECKNKIIESVASVLTKLNETKNLSLLDEAFRIICEDPLPEQKEIKNPRIKPENLVDEINKSIEENVSMKEESLNEIEGTPTGRTSPIIQSKKSRNSTKTLGKSSDHREKTKCPDNWSTSEKKTIKLFYSTPTRSKPGNRLRQSRLNIVNMRRTEVVDLTRSPELSAVIHNVKNESQGIRTSVKNEPLGNNIVPPSPTSDSVKLTLKASAFSSPIKLSKNSLSLTIKKENTTKSNVVGNTENEPKSDATSAEDSINILNPLPKRFPNTFEDPIKIDPIDNDETNYETNLSLSLLDDRNEPDIIETKQCSPTKRPLAENINIVNTPPKKRESNENYPSKPKITLDNVKRRVPESAECLYKEPAVRTKSEKRALPGWCCDKCEHFFGELYKDNPEMMAKKIEECSRHRGKQNPVVPKATSNFWNPRWSVPEDTEELNRMNNAI